MIAFETDVEYWKITSCKDCSHFQFWPATVILTVAKQTKWNLNRPGEMVEVLTATFITQFVKL